MLKLFIKVKKEYCVRIFLTSFLICVVILLFLAIILAASFFDVWVILAMSSPAPPSADTPQNRSWVARAEMPTPRSEAGSDALNAKIYIVGGYDVSGNTTDIMEVYDSRIDEWSTAASLPQPLDHPAVASHDNKLYVVGGFYSDRKTSDRLFIYDPVSNKWQEGPPMPSPRAALTANFVDGILYAVGGDSDWESWSTNYAYDPSSNKWTEKSHMPTARHHLASAVVDGKLYVIGGRYSNMTFNANLNSNEVYDPKNNTWTSLAPMPTKRSGLVAASSSVGGNVWVFGGELAFTSDTIFDVSERYDPETNKWASEQPMPTARHSFACEWINGRIYLIGGDPEPGKSVTGINEVFVVRP